MRRIGIKKTKWNIFLLFVIGLIIGVALGLRQPVSNDAVVVSETVVQPVAQEVAQ